MIQDEFKGLVFKIGERLSGVESVETVIVFGSVARGESDRRSDVDVCVILSSVTEKNRKMVREACFKLEEEFDRNIQPVITDPKFSELDRSFVNTVLREGIVVFSKKPVLKMKDLELTPFVIFYYDLKNKTQAEKVRLSRILRGFKSVSRYKGKEYVTEKKGLLEEVHGKKLGRGSIIVTRDQSGEIESTFKNMGVKYRKIEMWGEKI